MLKLLILPVIVALSACGAPRQPVFDLTGVDMGRYSRDQAACEEERKQTSFSLGSFETKCMERRGYKTLVSG